MTYFLIGRIIIQVTPGCGWRYNFNGGKAETSGWDGTYAINDELSDFAIVSSRIIEIASSKILVYDQFLDVNYYGDSFNTLVLQIILS